ncbi:glycosyltransferase [Azospirillum thermophilum]|nr:glycosyltransferase [Azospirillum thermophilum]
MRILLVHERYRQRGGEDVVVETEQALLAAHGADVATLIDDNARIGDAGSLRLAAGTVWSREGYGMVSRAVAEHRPDILHVHNTFPLLSPSIYYAAQRHGIPVVQTLHNFRLMCANGFMLRDGKACDLCLERTVKWPAVRHACYRDSRLASAAVAAMAGFHHGIGTWRSKVDLFLALNPHSRNLFIKGGLPPDRVAVCPPAVRDPGPRPAENDDRAGALFVGRLSQEKGLEPLIEAWRGIDAPLDIIGEGPLGERLAREAPPQVRFLGGMSYEGVSAAMTRSSILLFPSLWYENFPLVVAEAMAHGLPVLASADSAVVHMISDGETGAFALAGDVADWRNRLSALMARPDRLRRMGRAARTMFETRFSDAPAYERRMALYRQVLAARAHPAPDAGRKARGIIADGQDQGKAG